MSRATAPRHEEARSADGVHQCASRRSRSRTATSRAVSSSATERSPTRRPLAAQCSRQSRGRRLQGPSAVPRPDRRPGVHRRARRRASRDLEDREPRCRRRRRHHHRRHARHRSRHRPGGPRRLHPAPRPRQRRRQRPRHGGNDEGLEGRGDHRDRPPEARRRRRLLERQDERRQHARDEECAALRPRLRRA